MKFLSSMSLAIARWFNPEYFASFERREQDLLSTQGLLNSKLGQASKEIRRLSEIVIRYHNDETGPVFDNAPDWTPEDAGNLLAFLKTDTGRCLAKRFQVVSCNQAVMGCRDVMHTTYAAGNGNGWGEACEWFLKLSRVTGAQVTNDEQAQDGEAQLLERMAP